MTQRLHLFGLDVAKPLAELVALEIAPGTGIDTQDFWRGVSKALDELMPQNKALLKRRNSLQIQIDAFYEQDPEAAKNPEKMKKFLMDIGYLEPVVNEQVNVQGVDSEIAMTAGPQLVVPVNNARYAINAANARWGSLYDALYSSDVISDHDGAEKGDSYNPLRGQKVIEFAARQLDLILPLKHGSHLDVIEYQVEPNLSLSITLASSAKTSLVDPSSFIGYRQDKVLLFVHHGLHLELVFDPRSTVGMHHPAGLKDIIIEAAITTIQDCEDSVAAVDCADKVIVYRNWLGLMQGNLTEKIEKNDRIFERQLASDRFYTGIDGETIRLSGRSLMLVRNVGLLPTTDTVLKNGVEIPEGILDGFMTAFAAIHDIKNVSQYKNSKTGCFYIVKPKLHGPQEVEFTVALCSAIENTLGLTENTIKIGIMDEERRTSLNLGACIGAAKNRIIFINTGFLDRTGDEIRTGIKAGPMVCKAKMKSQSWLLAYEQLNVAQGLAAGMHQKAQIGKGMWPKPDLLSEMFLSKSEHPKAGASCAWVPSPTAAVLHALHYHQNNVAQIQRDLLVQNPQKVQAPNAFLDLLKVPVSSSILSRDDIIRELENNAQSILGYVVRWVQEGIGCSKVPDIHNIGLMEDRATLRISSQHMANWLYHNLCTIDDVMTVMRKMAKVVDRQNQAEGYVPMGPDFEASLAFRAACDLVIEGIHQPNGYTELLLAKRRREFKQLPSAPSH